MTSTHVPPTYMKIAIGMTVPMLASSVEAIDFLPIRLFNAGCGCEELSP